MSSDTSDSTATDSDESAVESADTGPPDTWPDSTDTGESGVESGEDSVPDTSPDSSGDSGETGDSGDSSGEAATWVQVSVYALSACALSSTGAIACWGDYIEAGEDSPPSGTYTEVSLGCQYACALDGAGAPTCWGLVGVDSRYDYGQTTPPSSGPYHGLSAGYMQTCALDASDAVVCWGRQDDPDWVPPTGAYTQVSVGDQGACAVNTAGELVCWGGYDYIPGPTASIVQVAAGAWHVCVLDLGGYVTCASEKYAIDDSPEGYQFVSIDAGDFGTDGITTASEVVGWNAHASGLDASRTWVQVSLGSGVCMLAADGVIECGGGYYLNMVPSPP